MVTIDTNFKDINFKNFENSIIGTEALNKSIDNIVTFNVGSVPSFPEFSDNSGILFEQLDSITISNYSSKLRSALSKYDNRIIMNSIDITRDTLNPNALFVNIKYTIRNTQEKKETIVKVNI